jgi:hypothetical protein
MTAQDKSRLLLLLQDNTRLRGIGIVVCEYGSFPTLVRGADRTEPRGYITLHRIDTTNRDWLAPTWQRHVEVQLATVGAPRTRIAHASYFGGEYVCFLNSVVRAATDSAGDESNEKQLDEAQEELMEMSQSFNPQFLMLQQQMQDESRRFTLLSNIMKTKHDTAKNSISNLR